MPRITTNAATTRYVTIEESIFPPFRCACSMSKSAHSLQAPSPRCDQQPLLLHDTVNAFLSLFSRAQNGVSHMEAPFPKRKDARSADGAMVEQAWNHPHGFSIQACRRMRKLCRASVRTTRLFCAAFTSARKATTTRFPASGTNRVMITD